MKYPFEEDIIPGKDRLRTEDFEENCEESFFPEIVSNKFVAVRGTIKSEWKQLFLSLLSYAVNNDIKYMIFVWPDSRIKVKTKEYLEMNKTKILSNNVCEYFNYPSLIDSIEKCETDEIFQVKICSTKRLPKLSAENPSCICKVNELNLNVFAYTMENVASKELKDYISNCTRYSSSHGFNHIIFQVCKKSRSSEKDILDNVVENINNSEKDNIFSKIVLNMDFELFNYKIKKIKKFLSRFETDISLCLDALRCQVDSYILLKTLIENNIPISIVYVSNKGTAAMRNTIKYCTKNSIPMIIPLNNEIDFEDLYIFRSVVNNDLLKRLKKYFTKKCTKRYPITIHGNETITPRTQLLFADEGIDYMNYSTTQIPSKNWNDDLSELREVVKELATYTRVGKFLPNSCLVNGYINPEDKVGAHRDKNLKDGNDIVCTVSIGGTRRFTFRKYKENKIIHEIEVHNGDVVFMMGDINTDYTHSIEAYRQKDTFEFKPRFSATFRHI